MQTNRLTPTGHSCPCGISPLQAAGISLGFAAITVGLAIVLRRTPLSLAGGLLVASVTPCTVASAAVWTRRAGGNDSLAILSTVDADGSPDSAGVNYGLAPAGRELVLYVMTRRHLKKARNIARNPRVSLVVPLQRRLLRFIPPATIRLRGRAEILDWTDEQGTAVFRGFWMGRRILDAYERSRRDGETRVCFLRITLDPVIRTYAVGHSLWDLRRRMESATGTVRYDPDGVGPLDPGPGRTSAEGLP